MRTRRGKPRFPTNSCTGCDFRSIIRHGTFSPCIINEAQKTNLNGEEYQLLNLGPGFIYDDSKMAPGQCKTELSTLKRKITID